MENRHRSKFPPHIKAKELQEKLPEDIWKIFFKFAFVRNPWDWLFKSFKNLAYHLVI